MVKFGGDLIFPSIYDVVVWKEEGPPSIRNLDNGQEHGQSHGQNDPPRQKRKHESGEVVETVGCGGRI